MPIRINNNPPIDLSRKFPDGTFAFRLEFEDSDLSIFLGYKAVITWNYRDESEFAALYYITKCLRERNVEKVILVMPYIPNARMDRIKSDNEIFTLKYFCGFINSLGFDKVVVFDPHSSTSLALLDRVTLIPPDEYIENAIRQIDDQDLMLFYPDEGAMKRYSDQAACPYGFGIKQRRWKTGEITALEIHAGDISGKNILIVDDICSRGGTFYRSAKALREAGAGRIYVFCSHCENTVFSGKLLEEPGLIEHVYTTDSIYTGSHEKITAFHFEYDDNLLIKQRP